MSGLRVALFWVFLAILGAFVLFAEFVAVGGGADPIKSIPTAAPVATPSVATIDGYGGMVWSLDGLGYSLDSSSNTSSPLS